LKIKDQLARKILVFADKEADLFINMN
jgi:hypothetical protein